MNKITQILLIICGTLCVTLGLIGIFIPILPTTPFLLLAAFFYARSSQRFYNWLLNNRLFGEYIRNYREGKGMPLKQKVITIALLWITIGVAAIFLVSSVWISLGLMVIGAGVTIHLVSIPTSLPEPESLPENRHLSPSEDMD